MLIIAHPFSNQIGKQKKVFQITFSIKSHQCSVKTVVKMYTLCFHFLTVSPSLLPEETKQVLRLSLTEFSLPKFYLLFGISKVKSAAVIAFRSSYRDRSFSPGSYERETFALSSLETVTEALLEIMEVCVTGSSLSPSLWRSLLFPQS